ncbi:cysteine-rich CWC family protein [Chloroflexota bacterium]
MTENSRIAPDPAICPLCGSPNHCAMAADPDAGDCWCESVVFPQDLLESIPENSVRKTCICKKCLDEYYVITGSSGGPKIL